VEEGQTNNPVAQEALDALRTYLSDSIAPLIFAESVEDLLKMPVRATGAEILGWVASQSHIGDAVRTADYLYHAVKKIHLLGELELLPKERLRVFISALRPILLESCPNHEREELTKEFANLEQAKGDITPHSGVMHMPTGAQSIATPGTSAARRTVEPTRSVLDDRRVGLLLHRLGSLLSEQPMVPAGMVQAGAVPAGVLTRSPLVAGIISEAAALAQNATELESSLGQLQSYGVPAVQDGIVRLLGQSLPNWAPPVATDEEQAPPQQAVRAMRRIIGMAESRQDKYKRFNELVITAVDEFNTGSLGRAVTLFDLAGRMIEDEEVDPTIVTTARDKAFAALDESQLRRCAETDDLHYLFRRVMKFFPHLSPEELFFTLEEEDSRDRRRLLLHLLSVQGADARKAALEALQGAVSGDRSFPWFLERNMVYLLRTIEREDDEKIDQEIDVLTRESDLENPLPLIREAFATLGQLSHERVVRTLVARVSELEDSLLESRQLPHSEEEVKSLLDTAITMLARTGSPEAHRCIVAHGLKRQPQLGNTLSRLSRLGSQDLSGDGTLVKRLVDALREELPTKVLGVSMGARRKGDNVARLIEALSGTDAPLVRHVLQEVSNKYTSQPFGEAAARAIEKLGVQAVVEESSGAALAGDLGLFGLPSLLQNLSDSQLTGMLSLIDEDGRTAAAMRLDGGLIRSARLGQLTGETAVYQLLERPVTGRFVFVDSEEESVVNMERGSPLPVQPLLFEGIRRYDEFTRAMSLAPDDATFRATEKKPTKVADEPSIELVKGVWVKAAGGTPPIDCELEFPVDAYRIRRLYEHWLSEGSLTARDAEEASAGQ
jgi:hypothetical protein